MHEKDRRWRDFYDRWAPTYDWMTRFWALVMGYSDTKERRKMVRRLKLKPGDLVLEVSVGTGSNLRLIAEAAPGGWIVGLDISRGMLSECGKKLQTLLVQTDLIESEGAGLPFADDSFDAALHFGGINEFGDPASAVREMMRVAKSGAKIVLGDESLKPEKRGTFWGRLLIRLNSLYAHDPPLEIVPTEAKNVRLRYFRGDACYLIDFVNP